MSTDPVFSLRNRWFTTAVAVTVLIAIASAAAGFVWFPALQAPGRISGVWDAICSAAGLIRTEPATQPVAPAFQTTQVVLTPTMLDTSSALSIGRGGTLALQCTMCHGLRGVSDADSPNLAGQYAPVIYKQLVDYRSGARVNAVMSPRAVGLSDQDIVDLAAYYAYLPRLPGTGTNPIPPIVASGAPMRNIAPCGSCHGTLDAKLGSPWLAGESSIYLRDQLRAFATGARHNDISEQMRNVARGMTTAEIEAAARYYGGQP
jgi:cytochrome c553